MTVRVSHMLKQLTSLVVPLCGAVGLMPVAVLCESFSGAQSQSPQVVEFEVAVVKPADPQSPVESATRFSANRFTATGTLRTLIQVAYGIQELQILGGPKWVSVEKFNIDAKSQGLVSRDEMKLMIRTLLTNRFDLVHRTDSPL